jgi:hypothetical protein
MIVALSQVEASLQLDLAPGVLGDERHPDPLAEVDGLVLVQSRSHAKNNSENTLAAGEILERNDHLVAGVQTKVEAQSRLDGCNSTGKILARFLHFQHSQIGLHKMNSSAGGNASNDELAASRPTDQKQQARQCSQR